ncbi:hypothetical protein Tco_0603191 [Tanacetum coccineum]
MAARDSYGAAPRSSAYVPDPMGAGGSCYHQDPLWPHRVVHSLVEHYRDQNFEYERSDDDALEDGQHEGEEIAYEQEGMVTRHALAMSEAHAGPLEARVQYLRDCGSSGASPRVAASGADDLACLYYHAYPGLEAGAA